MFYFIDFCSFSVLFFQSLGHSLLFPIYSLVHFNDSLPYYSTETDRVGGFLVFWSNGHLFGLLVFQLSKTSAQFPHKSFSSEPSQSPVSCLSALSSFPFSDWSLFYQTYKYWHGSGLVCSLWTPGFANSDASEPQTGHVNEWCRAVILWMHRIILKFQGNMLPPSFL